MQYRLEIYSEFVVSIANDNLEKQRGIEKSFESDKLEGNNENSRSVEKGFLSCKLQSF